jgi:hypothetical protein
VNRLDRNYELQVSLYQMIILILFNQGVPLQVNDIILQSGLNLADTMKSLKPLIDIHVLETVNGESLSQSSEIQVNTSFAR